MSQPRIRSPSIWRVVAAIADHLVPGAHSVELEVSFGKGEHFWTNAFPTQLLEKHAKEIKRFKWAIKFMRWFELICQSGGLGGRRYITY